MKSLALTLKQNDRADFKTIDAFMRYAETVFNRYKGIVKYGGLLTKSMHQPGDSCEPVPSTAI